ncbi:MAG: hypothetical protein JNJ50_18860 [Acidobacteria bacterium]|nr:hypothetical protein [Acidobacteriota bacterium]
MPSITMVTVDKSIPYQNNFTDKKSIVITFLVKRNKVAYELPLIPQAIRSWQNAASGQVINLSQY